MASYSEIIQLYPKSAYQLYIDTQSGTDGHLSKQERQMKAAFRWNRLSAEEKEPFFEEGRRRKQKYNQNLYRALSD